MTDVLAVSCLAASALALAGSVRTLRAAVRARDEARAAWLETLADQSDRLLATRTLLEYVRWVARKRGRRG